MYSLILKFVTPKKLVIVAAVLAIFAAGWTTNGWRYKAKMEKQKVKLAESYAKQQKQYLQEYREQQEADEAAAEVLSEDLARIRTHNQRLKEELRTSNVVKPNDEICANGGSGNPFGDDFARLWNAGTDDK